MPSRYATTLRLAGDTLRRATQIVDILRSRLPEQLRERITLLDAVRYAIDHVELPNGEIHRKTTATR